MNTIAHILQTTPSDYEEMLIGHFIYWCNLHAVKGRVLQSFISNQSLFSWYCRQVEAQELVFYDKLGGSKLPVNKLRNLYFDTLLKIDEYYPPKHLLQKIRKNGSKEVTGELMYNLN